MATLNYRAPADKEGNFLPWLHALRNQSGAYVIRKKSGAVLCVGESHTGNLARTIKRHFYPWKIKGWFSDQFMGREYNRCAVDVAVVTCPPAAAVGLQNNLIERLDPRDNGTPIERPF